MTKEKRVIPVRVVLYCGECETEMKHNGDVYLTNPPKYLYICPKCGYKETVRGQMYPYIKYIDG